MNKDQILNNYLEFITDDITIRNVEESNAYLFGDKMVMWERYVQHPFVNMIIQMFFISDHENLQWYRIKRMIFDMMNKKYP